MQIKCFKCNFPYGISNDNVEAALTYLEEDDLQHYDVKCPRCRKTNRISKEQLQHAAPSKKITKDD